ncbi:hypothetical protein MCOR13_011730 [Pyricularia oryzae]|nr:hypothetical protein MCOR13_011730 [Pyricularia oryzae]
MRTSTTIFASLSLLAGLVSAKNVEIQPDFQGVMTGGICCSPTPCEDASGQCDKAKLTPFCCGPFFNNRKKTKNIKGGCDPFTTTFPVGRLVKTFPSTLQGCRSNGVPGFIGCV